MVNLTPVHPATPAAAYIGGKRILAKAVIARINATPHEAYCEPFVGMGGIFLRRSLAPKMEAINDINGEVANLFRILQRHYPQFMDTLRFQVTSRREFRTAVQDRPVHTDGPGARGALPLPPAPGIRRQGSRSEFWRDNGRRPLQPHEARTAAGRDHERMSGVVIENLGWRAFIERYDRPTTLFYLDPPYWGCEDDYGKAVFSREDFAEMADVLSRIRGRFILSLNAVPGVFETFSKFEIEEVDCSYSIQGQGRAKEGEL